MYPRTAARAIQRPKNQTAAAGIIAHTSSTADATPKISESSGRPRYHCHPHRNAKIAATMNVDFRACETVTPSVKLELLLPGFVVGKGGLIGLVHQVALDRERIDARAHEA